MAKGENLEKPKKGGMVIVIGVGAKPKMKDKSKMKKAEEDSQRRRTRGRRRARTAGVAQAMQQRFNRKVGEGKIDLRNLAERRGIEEQELEGELARFNTSIDQLQSGEEVPKELNLQQLLDKLGARSTGARQQFFQSVSDRRRIPVEEMKEALSDKTDPTGQYQLDEVSPMMLEQDPNNYALEDAVREQQRIINRLAEKKAKRQQRISDSFRSSGRTRTDDPDDILYGGTDPTEESRKDEAIDTLARLLMGATNPRGSNVLFTPEEAVAMATRYIEGDGAMSSAKPKRAEKGGGGRDVKMPLRSQMFPQPQFTRFSSPQEEEAEEGMISFPRSMIEPTDKTGVANPRVLIDPRSTSAGQREESVPQTFRMSEDALTVLDAAWALLKGNPDMRYTEGKPIEQTSPMFYENLAHQIAQGEQNLQSPRVARDDDESAADIMAVMQGRKPDAAPHSLPKRSTVRRILPHLVDPTNPKRRLSFKQRAELGEVNRRKLRGHQQEAAEQTRNTMEFGNEDFSAPQHGIRRMPRPEEEEE